jgi:hypothetical protein
VRDNFFLLWCVNVVFWYLYMRFKTVPSSKRLTF